MLPSPSFHCDAVIANIQPTRVASEIGFRSVGSNHPTPPTVVRGRFGGSANSLEGPARMLAEGTLRETMAVAHPHRKLTRLCRYFSDGSPGTAPGLIRRLAVFAILLRSSSRRFSPVFATRQNRFARVVSVSLQVRTRAPFSKEKALRPAGACMTSLLCSLTPDSRLRKLFALRLQTQRAS